VWVVGLCVEPNGDYVRPSRCGIAVRPSNDVPVVSGVNCDSGKVCCLASFSFVGVKVGPPTVSMYYSCS